MPLPGQVMTDKKSFKLLYLDIETCPNLAYVWGLWNENIPLDRIIQEGGMLCWAAKWEGQREVMSASVHEEGVDEMMLAMYALLNEADAVVTYNGDRFDLPHINRLFLLAGLPPPAPYKKIDLLKTVRQQFKFASNKLDFVCKQLELGTKKDNRGFKTWVGCIAGEDSAWDTMIKYNKHDVVLTQKLYKKLKPWIKTHPNVALYVDVDKPVCPCCGSKKVHHRGTAKTNTGVYRRFRCSSCGTWSRSRFLDETRDDGVLVRYNG